MSKVQSVAEMALDGTYFVASIDRTAQILSLDPEVFVASQAMHWGRIITERSPW
tara:strand:- start:93 stop:254 length:162 start_codon:yes stop_codon:yes gene_type:complete